MGKTYTLCDVGKHIDRFLRRHRSAFKRVEWIVGVSRGGLIPAALIATRLDIPLVALYINRQDQVFIDRKEWIRGKRVLLVDDIVRTGKTMKKMIALLKRAGVRECKTLTLFTLRSAALRPTWTTLVRENQTFPWDKTVLRSNASK